MDYVKEPQNIVEKEKREPEGGNSDDKFAEVETTATFRIHEAAACNSEDGDILYSQGMAVKEPRRIAVIARDRVIAVIGKT